MALAAMSAPAAAGGFGIGTQSGSGTGNAFAGGAAAADDSSVAWYNPAAMTLLPTNRQVTAAIHLVKPSFKFTNAGSTGAFAAPGTGNGGDGGDWAAIPNGFYTMSINPRLKFGLAVNAPFGLATEYDPGWRGRFTAVESALQALNINPSLGYKVNDNFSIGGGISVQHLKATLSGASAAGLVTNKGDDTGFGYNFGLVAQLSPTTRLGATYRSAIDYSLEGTVTVSGLGAANGSIKADIKVPDSASISLFSTVSPKWELMADITWTGWSSIQRLDIIRTSASAGGAVGSTVSSLLVVRKVAVLGAGVMGAQIAAHLVNANVPVLLFELAAKEGDPNGNVLKAIDNLRKLEPSPLAVRERADHIEPANYDQHLGAARECDLVIEAISERMDWKPTSTARSRRISASTRSSPATPRGCRSTAGGGVARGAAHALLRRALLQPAALHAPGRADPRGDRCPAMLDELERSWSPTLGKGVVRAKDTPNFIANRVGVFSMLATCITPSGWASASTWSTR
jgi:hypothetical protein